MLSKVIKDNLAHNHMPDYLFELVEDKLIVRPIHAAVVTGHLAPLKPDTYDDARTHAPGWDVRVFEAEWRSWVTAKGIKVRNADANYITFCRKRGPDRSELF